MDTAHKEDIEMLENKHNKDMYDLGKEKDEYKS